MEKVVGTHSSRRKELYIIKNKEKDPTRNNLLNISTKKYRTKYAESMIDFIKKVGLYKDTLKIIPCHKFHCMFFGNYIALKLFYVFVAHNPGTTFLANLYHFETY